jgi:hypothetical protein
LIKSLDEQIVEAQQGKRRAQRISRISYFIALVWIVWFLNEIARNSGPGAAYYFSSEAVIIIAMYTSPVLVASVIAGFFFSLKSERRTNEIATLKQRLAKLQS